MKERGYNPRSFLIHLGGQFSLFSLFKEKRENCPPKKSIINIS